MGILSQDKSEDLIEDLEDVIPRLRAQLALLSARDLLAFDHILERKLYDLDRAEIQEYTYGSEDGFLYARGFIVAVGKEYYNAVLTKPAIALADFECEEMCYLSRHLYEENFGALPISEISRESCSNKAGWPII